ncbi:MAG: hypothetical protein ACYDDP_08340 [Acidithiobacillus sp.]
MNAVIQSSAHPLVVLERNTLITHALLGRLSAYTGSISRVSDLHRCKIALSAQRLTPVLFLAGKPLESRWADWKAQVKLATNASCPTTAIDLSKGSAAAAFLKSQISALNARMAVSALRSRLSFLGFDNCIVTFHGHDYQFNPPDTFRRYSKTAVRSAGGNTPFTDFFSSVRRFGAASF